MATYAIQSSRAHEEALKKLADVIGTVAHEDQTVGTGVDVLSVF